MSLEAARDLFRWPDENPRLTRAKPAHINGGALVPVYRYPFASLTFEGIQVTNPDIDIIPKKNYDERAAPVILGVSVLRQLHLYIGYKAQKLYLTAAEAR